MIGTHRLQKYLAVNLRLCHRTASQIRTNHLTNRKLPFHKSEFAISQIGTYHQTNRNLPSHKLELTIRQIGTYHLTNWNLPSDKSELTISQTGTNHLTNPLPVAVYPSGQPTVGQATSVIAGRNIPQCPGHTDLPLYSCSCLTDNWQQLQQ